MGGGLRAHIREVQGQLLGRLRDAAQPASSPPETPAAYVTGCQGETRYLTTPTGVGEEEMGRSDPTPSPLVANCNKTFNG